MPNTPSIEILRECLRLDADTGRLYWKARPRHHFLTDRAWAAFLGQFAGKEAFRYIGHNGYRQSNLHVAGELYRLSGHNVVWALHTGQWPAHTVDHRDMNRANNRPDNLRAATYAQQNENRPVTRRSLVGLKGVSISGNRFVAQIRTNGRRYHLGSFGTPEEAHAAYKAAADKHHGEFARA